MSFRTRLTMFFVVIVIVPMVCFAVVVFRLISDSENGKAEARVAARQDVVSNLADETQARAGKTAERLVTDPVLAAAVQSRQTQAAARRIRTLMRQGGIRRVVIRQGRSTLVDVGHEDAVFPWAQGLTDATKKRDLGTIQISVQGAGRFSRLAAQLSGLDVAIIEGDRVVASTLRSFERARLPASGVVTIDGRVYRVASEPTTGFDDRRLQVAVLDDGGDTSTEIRSARRVAAGVLAGFLLLAFACAILLSRQLNGVIESFLHAARRLGGGDFSSQVSLTGHDEFAALGDEFNKMSVQLENRLAELQEERARLQSAMRRIGETFASNLDRDGLLEIAVRTAVEGVGADGGRAVAFANGNQDEPAARSGDLSGIEDVLRDAESAALVSGTPAAADAGDVHALAQALGHSDSGQVLGTLAVGRAGRPFSDGERELFRYLVGQASVSIENVGLHETVERQAVTDELTGLFNRRRFDEVLQTEVERAKRFGQELGLVMIDIDDFKKVNDTYGHPQGDLVLQEVARILKKSAREIDEPARYGGEELAMVLPGTDLEGARSLAERVRAEIEELAIAQIADGAGPPLRVTASFGVATLPSCAQDVRGLIEAADAALYRAKSAGKNKVVPAG